ncbi:reverse transcriptase domain-containing protein [Effusibacillus consociatus]|uniref:RNA-directed DNA polymerase n=1 Tax=Effusibacillus consociatus TaxID=1117041 RepID=A0ABV9PXZ7_9BACL
MNAVKSANNAKVKAQQLQNVLYLAAKGNPRRRFHALYDKVHGAPRRHSLGSMETGQGERRKRRAVKKGVYWVVDIDIRGYFDNISHEKLMQLVEQRISDRRILKLIRKWLKAGFVKDDQFHETDLGSPQGGVISPLLANIYLNYLDTIWEKKFAETGTLVRYADDLVVLCKTKEQALRAINVLKAVFGKLELEMNKAKSNLSTFGEMKKASTFWGCTTGKYRR